MSHTSLSFLSLPHWGPVSLSPVGEDVPASSSMLAQALFPHCHPLTPHLGSALSLPLEKQPEAIAVA